MHQVGDKHPFRLNARINRRVGMLGWGMAAPRPLYVFRISDLAVLARFGLSRTIRIAGFLCVYRELNHLLSQAVDRPLNAFVGVNWLLGGLLTQPHARGEFLIQRVRPKLPSPSMGVLNFLNFKKFLCLGKLLDLHFGFGF